INEPAPSHPRNAKELAAGSTVDRDSPSDQPIRDAVLHFNLRQQRLSDITVPVWKWLYSMGALHLFNLFDGPQGIVFFGDFSNIDGRRAQAHLICLLKNISLSYSNISNFPEGAQKDAREILGLLSIELVTNVDRSAIHAVIKGHLPAERSI